MSDKTTVMLRNVRGAFLHVHRPQVDADSGKESYGGSFLMEPDTAETAENIAKVDAAMKAAASEKWGAKAPDVYKSLKAGGRVCLRDGDTKAEYEGFAGTMFVSASNSSKPTLVDRVKDSSTGKPRRLEESDGKSYSGARYNVKIEVWAQDNKFGKRINASLMGLQFWEDGPRFGGGAVASEDDFDAEETAAAGDDPFDGDDIPF